MPDILAVILPIFLLMALGFAAVRGGLVAREGIGALSRYVIDFALPAVLFRTLAARPPGGASDAAYLLAYGGGSLLVFGFAVALARLGRGKSLPAASLFGMGMSFSNSVFIGLPVVVQALGPEAGVAVALCLVIENFVMFPLILMLAEGGRAAGGGASRRAALRIALRRTVATPIVPAIALGAGFALFGIGLPAVLSRPLELLAASATPVALFVIGGSLVGLRLRGMGAEVAQIAIGKLVGHPLAVLAMLALLPDFDVRLQHAAVLLAAMPMPSIYPAIGQRYGEQDLCAASALVATTASFVSLSMVLWLLRGP